MFDWLEKRRVRKILEQPFKDEWRSLLEAEMLHWRYLSEEKRLHLEHLTQVFVGIKNWEGCNGLDITEEMQVLIAAQACLLILNLPHNLYRRVESILVYPTAIIPRHARPGFFSGTDIMPERTEPVIGQAHMRGPVILVWDAVKRCSRHPERGHNVTYHEFAHKLDMLDGRADGTPPLHGKAEYKEWIEVFSKNYFLLKEKLADGRKTFLNPYAATNEAEFFAVATEYFFDKPCKMRESRSELYQVLSAFYNQDPAQREELYKASH